MGIVKFTQKYVDIIMEKCYDIYIDILRMELIELCVK